jgi:hypothetical protein
VGARDRKRAESKAKRLMERRARVRTRILSVWKYERAVLRAKLAILRKTTHVEKEDLPKTESVPAEEEIDHVGMRIIYKFVKFIRVLLYCVNTVVIIQD